MAAPLATPQAENAPARPVALQAVAGVFLLVGVFVTLSGLVFLQFHSIFAAELPFAILLWGALLLVVSGFLFARHQWAWVAAMGLVAWGEAYAILGLVRGKEAGMIGIVLWGALGVGLMLRDVRAACGFEVG